jgi:hypothetical protein
LRPGANIEAFLARYGTAESCRQFSVILMQNIDAKVGGTQEYVVQESFLVDAHQKRRRFRAQGGHRSGGHPMILLTVIGSYN